MMDNESDEIKKINIKKVILLIILLLILLTALIYAIMRKEHIKEEIWNIETSNYKINIDLSQLNNKEDQEEIIKYLREVKKEFEEENKDYKSSKNNNIIYELKSTNQKNEFNGIKKIKITTIISKGENNVSTKEKIFYYKQSDNTKLTFEDILENKEKFDIMIYYNTNKALEELKTEKNINYKIEDLKKGLNNYKFEDFAIEKRNLVITYNQIDLITWEKGAIEVKIPLSELKGIIKNDYLQNINNHEEIIENKIQSKTRNIEELKGKKIIALTFDDGPSTENDKRIVNALKKYNGRATFFVLGNRIHSNKEGLKYAYSEGNQIGSHTFNHLNLPRFDKYKIAEEIYKTDDIIYKTIGIKPSIIRPPYGNRNKTVIDIANRDIILWSVDTLDWKTKNAESVKNEILKHAQDGAIILMHDIYKTSVEGAIAAMPELKSRGFEFVTIDEMKKIKGINEQSPKIYYSFKTNRNLKIFS